MKSSNSIEEGMEIASNNQDQHPPNANGSAGSTCESGSKSTRKSVSLWRKQLSG
jgi:hypothetical protein